MIFRIVNWLVMAIAMFYVLEGTGLIEKGKYFPTLPRLDSRAGDPMAWLGAAQWGFNQIGGLASSRSGGGADFPTGTAPSSTLSSITDSSIFQNFSNRLSQATGGKFNGGSLSSALGGGGSGGGTGYDASGGYHMNYLSGYK